MRIKNPTYSVANKSISTSDQRDANGHGGGRNQNETEDTAHEQPIKSPIDATTLQEMIEALNSSEYYQKKGFTFKCRDDAPDLHVEVYTAAKRMIQRLPPEQIQKMFEALNLEHKSSKIGSLIDVSC